MEGEDFDRRRHARPSCPQPASAYARPAFGRFSEWSVLRDGHVHFTGAHDRLRAGGLRALAPAGDLPRSGERAKNDKDFMHLVGRWHFRASLWSDFFSHAAFIADCSKLFEMPYE
jgi:hypothetical protein